MNGWIIVLAVIAVLGIAGGVGWSFLSKEHNEARSLLLNAVNFSNLRDGIYQGVYEGGMYKWRANTAEVTVSSGKVSAITLVDSSFEYKDTEKLDALYCRVIEQQTLQVDTISGATLTSKGYLQAVENALLQAE
jgi:uncharacterized protein with FMN-binding domain